MVAVDAKAVGPLMRRREIIAEMTDYTKKQGQYLAFIYNYTKIHDVPPSEMDLQQYFRTTPPTVHQMILTLEKRGFIHREAGKARSIRVLLSPDQLPYLE